MYTILLIIYAIQFNASSCTLSRYNREKRAKGSEIKARTCKCRQFLEDKVITAQNISFPSTDYIYSRLNNKQNAYLIPYYTRRGCHAIHVIFPYLNSSLSAQGHHNVSTSATEYTQQSIVFLYQTVFL
jgi:hypothetical protein